MFIGAASNVTVAAVAQIDVAQPINNTITHLDAALKQLMRMNWKWLKSILKLQGNHLKASLAVLLKKKHNAVHVRYLYDKRGTLSIPFEGSAEFY
ncbi:MAG: hypothetical protein WC856_12855 [Methylococcaceae bacterium]